MRLTISLIALRDDWVQRRKSESSTSPAVPMSADQTTVGWGRKRQKLSFPPRCVKACLVLLRRCSGAVVGFVLILETELASASKPPPGEELGLILANRVSAVRV